MGAADSFLSFLVAHGLAPSGRLEISEGEVQRFRVEGDKAGSRNGWCVLHSHPVPWGVAGSWKTGEQHYWREAEPKRYTAAERAEQRRQVAAAREAREKAQAELHAQARERAARLWRAARPATDAHPYLQRKAVRAYGLKQLRDALLVPARSADGHQSCPLIMTKTSFLERTVEASLALHAWASSGDLRRHFGGDAQAFIRQRLASLEALTERRCTQQADGIDERHSTGEPQP